jgi:hypothetical protein
MPSFQVLAKVLCLIPGLDQDAAIAASCQFYPLITDSVEDEGFDYDWKLSFGCTACEVSIVCKGGDD